MKKAVLLLFITVPFLTQGQESEASKTSEIIIGVGFSPDYSYRDLKHDGTETMKTIVALNNSVESAKFGYTAGIFIQFPLVDKLKLETGLYFADKGEQLIVDGSTLTFGDMIDPRYGFVYETAEPIETVTINHNYFYLDIPLELGYVIVDKKLKLSVTAGLALNTLVGYRQKSKTKYTDGSTKVSSNNFTSANLNRFSLGFVGAISLDYPLGGRLGLKLEPTYRRSITAINNDPIKQYLYSVGLSVGLTYKLGG